MKWVIILLTVLVVCSCGNVRGEGQYVKKVYEGEDWGNTGSIKADFDEWAESCLNDMVKYALIYKENPKINTEHLPIEFNFPATVRFSDKNWDYKIDYLKITNRTKLHLDMVVLLRLYDKDYTTLRSYKFQTIADGRLEETTLLYRLYN